MYHEILRCDGLDVFVKLRQQRNSIHCNTMQHTATHYNTLQHTTTHPSANK